MNHNTTLVVEPFFAEALANPAWMGLGKNNFLEVYVHELRTILV